MIILLYGKDTYRSREKLEKIVKEYKEKHESGLNLNFFEGDFLDDFHYYEGQVSMFGEKRLTVIKNVFSSGKAKSRLLENLKKIVLSDDLFVIHEDGEIKKGDELFKALEKEKKGVMSQEFRPLSGKKLSLWIKKEFEKNKAEADKEVVFHLEKEGGEDLWKIKNEIDKLSLYAGSGKIKKEDINLIANSEIETNIFKTIDAIAEKDKEKAFLLLYDHLEKGENHLYLLSMIGYQFRNLIVVSDLEKRGFSYEEMKKKSGLHPFVFKKSFYQAKKFSFDELKEIINLLFQIDLKAKTGQTDPVLAIHLFLFGI